MSAEALWEHEKQCAQNQVSSITRGSCFLLHGSACTENEAVNNTQHVGSKRRERQYSLEHSRHS